MTTPAHAASTPTPFLSNKMYDSLKWTAQIFLPALGTLYFGLSQIWGFPKGAEVVGTITIIDTFLGVLLGLATKSYNASDAPYDGSIDVFDSEGKKTYSLTLNSDPEALDQKSQVVFKVNPS